MKEIKLTKGKVALVDDEDYDYLMQWKWCIRYNGNYKNFYAIRGFSKSKHINVGSISMHRQLMKPEKGYVIDHLDGNTLNNQKTNLRICTQSDNCKNQKMSINNKCGYKGVCQQKNSKKFISQICYNNKKIYLGSFISIIDAARAYNEAAIKFHGEFANLNKI